MRERPSLILPSARGSRAVLQRVGEIQDRLRVPFALQPFTDRHDTISLRVVYPSVLDERRHVDGFVLVGRSGQRGADGIDVRHIGRGRGRGRESVPGQSYGLLKRLFIRSGAAVSVEELFFLGCQRYVRGSGLARRRAWASAGSRQIRIVHGPE